MNSSQRNSHFMDQLIHFVFLLMIPTIVLGQPSGVQTLDNLLQEADSVIIGHILQGSVSDRNLTVKIKVERSLKGSLTKNSSISAIYLLSPRLIGSTRSIDPIRGMFFISTEGITPHLLALRTGLAANEYLTFIPLPNQSQTVLKGDSVKDNILLELLSAMSSGLPKQSGGILDLPYELRNHQSKSILAALKKSLNSDNASLRGMSAGFLASRGDPETLRKLETDESFRNASPVHLIADPIKYFYNNAQPEPVRTLGRIATNEKIDSVLRISAAYGIARVHTADTLPYFAKLLDASDIQLRTAAVGGFSRFANNSNPGKSSTENDDWKFRTEQTIKHSTMSIEAVQKNEPYYLDFWKRWWAENQRAVNQ